MARRIPVPIWCAMLDLQPVLYSPRREAWTLTLDGRWLPADYAECMHSGTALSRALFDRLFPDLPPLPKDAFKQD
jgi:hypothetical protein